MMQCKRCGSWAINHNSHGRCGSDPRLCDVCYWRKRAEEDAADATRYRQFFVSGLPITFESVEYRSKADLDAAMDAARATHGKDSTGE